MKRKIKQRRETKESFSSLAGVNTQPLYQVESFMSSSYPNGQHWIKNYIATWELNIYWWKLVFFIWIVPNGTKQHINGTSSSEKKNKRKHQINYSFASLTWSFALSRVYSVSSLIFFENRRKSNRENSRWKWRNASWNYFLLSGHFSSLLGDTQKNWENQSIIFLSLLYTAYVAIYGYLVFELYTHIFETMDNVVMF